MTRALAARYLSSIALAFVLLARVACADDAPAFDRPGLSFAPSTLPAGTFDWEQGLPDAERNREDGIRSTSYSADTTLRFGMTSSLEAQISTSAWNRLVVHSAASTMHTEGAGDTRVGIKWAPALPADDLSLALLAAVTADTGSAAFSNGRPIVSLGATMARKLGEDSAVALYANVDRSGGSNTWTLSPNFSFPIAGSLDGYVEAGRNFGGGSSDTLAGGGLTWLLRKRVQLDVYARCGLTARSPDVQAGFGISSFWR